MEEINDIGLSRVCIGIENLVSIFTDEDRERERTFEDNRLKNKP